MPSTAYQSFIDDATWAFIRRTEACYPPDTAQRSIAEQRRIYDAMARRFHHGYPAGIAAQDEIIDGVPCRIFKGAQPTVIYLHGGGFTLGGLCSHDDICAEIRSRTGLGVVCAGYRLAPEHRHPAAYDDALAVASAMSLSEPCLLVGDSAGGALAASVAHTMRGHGQPACGVVLIYPSLGGHTAQGSYLTHADAPLLSREDVLAYGKTRYLNETVAINDPTASVLQDRDFANLPPTVVFSAECDPLCDDGRDYCTRITGAGGSATSVTEQGLVHGYLRARHSVPRASRSFDKIISAIAELGATA